MRFTQLLSATALAGSLALALPAAAQQAQPSVPSTTPPVAPADSAAPVDATDQSGADGAAPEGGEVVVTGSLVARPQLDGNIPGVQITNEQIQARGFGNALDAINDIPLIGPGASPFGTNGGQPASLGSAFPDILDLGTNRTLTLVNGRRFVTGNSASLFVAGNTSGSQVDLNSIPSALIERADVLTVGGAVAYGSEAIAGVINLILKTDFDGVSAGALSGISQRGDAAYYRLNAVAGTNFAGGRGNVTVAFEYNRDDALNADAREGYVRSFSAPTSFRNGSVRNTAFAPSLTGSSLPFLPSASDGVPNNIAGTGYSGGSIGVSDFGQIFQLTGSVPSGFQQGIYTANPNTAAGFRPGVGQSLAGNVNLIPGVPIGTGAGCSVTNLTSFCNFAPTGLPGTAGSAQQTTFINAVLTRYAPSFVGQGTAAQRSALAVQLLQANLPTPREYFAANPGTDPNAFIGTFVPAFLDVSNRGGNAGVLPQVAVPLRFDAAGNVVPYTSTIITDPRTIPGTVGGAIGGDYYNNVRNTTLRVQQDRYIANLFGKFEVAPELTLYTENLYARIRNVAPYNGASSNTITSTTTENAVLALDISNPYLSAASVSTLRAAGVTSKFLVSRTNQDIVGDNPAETNNESYRTLVGARGAFDAFGKNQVYDVAVAYSHATITGKSFQIKDIEYALAIDAVRDASGNIVCRSQTNPSAFVGQTPFGVAGQELTRTMGANGVLQETLLRRTATADQIAACRPLNVLGTGNFTAEARNYVLARTGFTNDSDQYLAKANLSGGVFDLPGGTFRYGLGGEYRREDLNYRADELSRIGGTRTAALASTMGKIEAYELGGELIVPITGEDFKLPLIQGLTFNPGIRFSKQDGSAPSVRTLNGSTLNQRSNGRWNTIYSLAGDWNPIPDLRIRGNWTRSIRQPSVVELFLGGQPSFTAPSDPCSQANITGGTTPDIRRANCRAAVIAGGYASDATGADAFLNSYVPSGGSVTGTFVGSPNLRAERGKSWTVGGVFQPRFLKGFALSVDYFNVKVEDQIIPAGVGQAIQVCYDSASFPNTAPQVGVNVCNFFSRVPAGQTRAFEVDNGFNSGFINLGALRVEAINATMRYDVGLSGLFGERAGKFGIYANVYHPLTYLTAPDNNFATAQQSVGTFLRPDWETQLRGRYDNGGFYTQWVWNWQSRTRLFNSGAPVAGTNESNEVQDFIIFPAYGTHSATIGYNFGEQRRFGMQLVVQNVLDKQYVGTEAQAYAFGYQVDNIGRRFVMSVNVRF